MNFTWLPRSRRLAVWSFGISALLGSLFGAQAARTEMDLSGSWQYQKVTQLTYPPSNTWQTITIPSFLSGWQYEHAWFRTTFTLPSSLAGTQLKLRFGGVKYNAQIWLNGAFLGSYLNGYNPFELDITSAALINQTNELLVAVTDWTATFSTPVDFSNLAPYESPRDHAKNAILAPIGGRYELYGIWQPAKIVSVPAVSIDNVFVMPSVRTQQLTVRLTLRNDSASSQTVNVTNRVLDGTSTVLTLPDQQLVVPPLTNLQVDVTAPWPAPHLWTPADPHLYFVETTVAGGAGQDQLKTRFGFREFWASGGGFFLNGTPIHLLATATWPPTDLKDTNVIRQVLSDVKAGNNVAIRLHTQPWDEKWYDVADEVGLLIVEECAVWCDPYSYRLSDATFWTNYSQHLAAAVQRDRNHPAIVLWSLENEILHCGGEKAYSATDVQLAAMGRLVKGLDPTRPITYEADLDPGGVADALGLHYPHEFPDFQVWPNAAYWMDQSIPRDWVPGGQWLWDRTKPLYIGEFLWVPSTSAADFTILFGDDAYSDPAYYRLQAKGLTWKMQIEAYRSYGVNGTGPWTEFEDPAVDSDQFNLHPAQNYLYQVQKAAYAPNAVVVQEYNPRFFTGDTVPRTVHVYNEQMSAGSFNLRYRAGAGTWQSQALALPPAGHWTNTLAFQAPGATGPFGFQVELSQGTNIVFTNSLAYSALAHTNLSLPPGFRLALYDPAGTTAPLFQRFGLGYVTVTNLHTAPYSELDLVVVGRNALTNDSPPEVGSSSVAAQWQTLALRGGWVFVLEQTNYPAWMPGGAQLQNYDASFAFPNPDHALTSDLTANDLRWWAPDHRLVRQALSVPARGNFRVLAGIGSHSGLEYAAALEIPLDAGGILCSQWLLVERFDVEPLAAVLLQRLLNYCASPTGHLRPRPAALLAEPTSPAASRLAQLGLLSENFSGRITNCDPALYPVLIVTGSNATWLEARTQLNSLTRYVDAGGKLLLHRPDEAFLAAAQTSLLPDLDTADASLGPVLRRDVTNAAARILNHDLYWVAQAGDWNKPEVLTTNIAQRTYRKRFALTNYTTIQVLNMPIHTSGGAGSGGWWLYSNGSVAQDITVSQSGPYLFSVTASGTPALGGWPLMSLRLDGRALDSATVSTNQLATYTLSATLTAGTHQLSVSFDNDLYSPPEDRNLFLTQIRWGLDNDAGPSVLLTSPGAIAQVRRGNGLILLDEITWDTETQNLTKANRFACELLTGLGAALRPASGVVIDPTTMSNVNVAAYSISGGVVWLNSNGRIETSLRVTAAGTYTFQVTAGGTAAAGVLPQIALVVDGANRAIINLTSTNLTIYTIKLALTAGTHAIGLGFLNDYYSAPEDRNAAFGSLTITAPAPPRITSFNADPVQHLATLQWETTPGQPSDVQVASNLLSGFQAAVTLTNPTTVASWQDLGGPWGPPPLSPGSFQRFYRIRQTQ